MVKEMICQRCENMFDREIGVCAKCYQSTKINTAMFVVVSDDGKYHTLPYNKLKEMLRYLMSKKLI